MRPNLLISADSHVSEPLELWRKRVDRRFRDRAPHYQLNPGDLEGAYFVYEGLAPQPITVGISAGRTADQLSEFLTTATYADGPAGGWDPAARQEDNARDGVLCDVLYTTLGMRLFSLGDALLQAECFRVYNDWIAEFCAYDPSRMVGLALISLYDVEAGVIELERCAALGLRGAMIWCSPPSERPFHSRDYDRFWRAAEAMELPISLHCLTGMGPESRWAGYTQDEIDVGLLAQSTLLHAEVERSLTELILSGVFERFPRLHIVSAENGCGWLAHYLQRIDQVFESVRSFCAPHLRMTPTEYFRRNVYCTFIVDPVAIHNRHRIGVGNMLWSSDYPHGVSTWPNSQKHIEIEFQGVPMNERQSIVFDNVATLYKILV